MSGRDQIADAETPPDAEDTRAVGAAGESRMERRAQQAAERAEWARLAEIYFAYQETIAPGGHHCFCGSLDDLRRAVADLPRDHHIGQGDDQDRDTTAGASAAAVSNPPDGRFAVPDPDLSARLASHRAALSIGERTSIGDARREQLARWHADDHPDHGAEYDPGHGPPTSAGAVGAGGED